MIEKKAIIGKSIWAYVGATKVYYCENVRWMGNFMCALCFQDVFNSEMNSIFVFHTDEDGTSLQSEPFSCGKLVTENKHFIYHLKNLNNAMILQHHIT